MKLTTYELVLCALCAAVTCILAPISVPLAGEVPISLATFAVLLSGILLGGRFGAISQLVYVLLGSVGVPVFAGWTGGIGITLGVTGGYIIGYILMAFVAGLLYHLFGRNASGPRKYAAMFVSMVAATAALYILGTAWFMAQTRHPFSSRRPHQDHRCYACSTSHRSRSEKGCSPQSGSRIKRRILTSRYQPLVHPAIKMLPHYNVRQLFYGLPFSPQKHVLIIVN